MTNYKTAGHGVNTELNVEIKNYWEESAPANIASSPRRTERKKKTDILHRTKKPEHETLALKVRENTATSSLYISKDMDDISLNSEACSGVIV